jgi:3alpha(or 20beta)-hydroxysteroid dehydrogenase
MARLEGKVVLISGAARGIGEADARVLVAEGASVLIADVLADKGAALADELGERAAFVSLDVTRAENWAAAVALAESRFGVLTGLVNNAAIAVIASLEATTEAQFRRSIEVNQIGVLLGMQAVLPAMRRAGGGSIVNMSSIAGMAGSAGVFPYTATKWAVRGMTKAAAIELAADRIRVNSVHPGPVITPMTEAFIRSPERIPLLRHGQPEEIARLVAYLLSDESSFTTGAEHVIDGGMTAGYD